MSTFGGECQRKWAFRVVAKIQSEPTKAALLGTSVDEGQLQPYLTQDRPFDFTKPDGSAEIAVSGLEFLPKPMTPGLQCQKKFILPGPSHERTGVGYGYLGYKDLWLPDSRVLPGIDYPHCTSHEDCKEFPKLGAACATQGIPAVVDFKTTGDFKWAKNEVTLKTDPQAVIYAMDAVFETGAPAVDLVWLYMRTKGARKAKRVHLRLLAEDIAREFKKIDDVGVEIVKTRKASFGAKDPIEFALSLPANPDACDGYGGCPYKSHCNLSPLENARFKKVLEAPVEDNGMSGGTLDLFANLAKRVDDAPAPAAPAPAPAPVMGMSDRDVPAPTEIPAALMQPLGINPPEKNLPPAPPVGSVSAPVETAATAPVEEKPKAKRGRPKKEETAPAQNVEEPALIGDVDPHASCVVGESFTVTWGEERFQIGDATCIVGPFSAAGETRPGETLSDAVRRVSAVLFAFAVEERATKLDSFKRGLK